MYLKAVRVTYKLAESGATGWKLTRIYTILYDSEYEISI